MAETKAETSRPNTYEKLVKTEEWLDTHCKCGSRHFRVAVIHEQRNAHVQITCGRCGWQLLVLWAPDWQVEHYAWAMHPSISDGTACIQCGTRVFAVKTQHESYILRVLVACNKCGQRLLSFGAAQYQFS